MRQPMEVKNELKQCNVLLVNLLTCSQLTHQDHSTVSVGHVRSNVHENVSCGCFDMLAAHISLPMCATWYFTRQPMVRCKCQNAPLVGLLTCCLPFHQLYCTCALVRGCACETSHSVIHDNQFKFADVKMHLFWIFRHGCSPFISNAVQTLGSMFIRNCVCKHT